MALGTWFWPFTLWRCTRWWLEKMGLCWQVKHIFLGLPAWLCFFFSLPFPSCLLEKIGWHIVPDGGKNPPPSQVHIQLALYSHLFSGVSPKNAANFHGLLSGTCPWLSLEVPVTTTASSSTSSATATPTPMTTTTTTTPTTTTTSTNWCHYLLMPTHNNPRWS